MRYPDLVSRVRSRKAELLEEGDYEKLLGARSVPEIADILSKTGYRDFIPDVDEIHRRDLEAGISRRLYKETEEFKRLLTFPEKKIMAFMILRCEIETLKKIFRIYVAGEEFVERFAVCPLPFDPKDLLGSPSMEDVISELSERPYHPVLSSALRKESYGTGYLENALDFWYFSNLYRMIKRYGTRGVLNFFQKQIDLMNSIWLFRARILFGLEPEEALGSVLPYGFHLKSFDLSKLANFQSVDEMISGLRKLPMFSEIPEGDIAPFVLERIGEKYLYREAERLSTSSNGFEAVIGYLHILEYETRNLITVIEVVRYSLEPGIAMEYIIRG